MASRVWLTGAVLATALFGAQGAHAQTPGVGDCQPNQYVDRTAAGVSRALDWSFAILSATDKCMKVQQGQSVTWSGDLEMHPLGSNGGDQPNPIGGDLDGVVTFTKTGTFGYVCTAHSAMKGAIFVVPAPAPPAAPAPAAPWWTLAGLAGALVAAGVVMLRRRASY